MMMIFTTILLFTKVNAKDASLDQVKGMIFDWNELINLQNEMSGQYFKESNRSIVKRMFHWYYNGILGFGNAYVTAKARFDYYFKDFFQKANAFTDQCFLILDSFRLSMFSAKIIEIFIGYAIAVYSITLLYLYFQTLNSTLQ